MSKFEQSFQDFLRMLDNGVAQPADHIWTLKSASDDKEATRTVARHRHLEKKASRISTEVTGRASRNWTY